MPIHDFGSPKEHKEKLKKENKEILSSPKIEEIEEKNKKKADLFQKENRGNKENEKKPQKENKIKISHPLIHGLLNIEEEEL